MSAGLEELRTARCRRRARDRRRGRAARSRPAPRGRTPSACAAASRWRRAAETAGSAAARRSMPPAIIISARKKMSPDSEREQQSCGSGSGSAVLLDPPERGEPEHEVERRRGDERVGRVDVDCAQVEQQRDAEQHRAADRAVQADDPAGCGGPNRPSARAAARRHRTERIAAGRAASAWPLYERAARAHLASTRRGRARAPRRPARGAVGLSRGGPRRRRTAGSTPAADAADHRPAGTPAAALARPDRGDGRCGSWRMLTSRSANSTTKKTTIQKMILPIARAPFPDSGGRADRARP